MVRVTLEERLGEKLEKMTGNVLNMLRLIIVHPHQNFQKVVKNAN